MANTLNLNDILVDGGTQSRVGINNDVVNDYAEELKRGAEFPPVVVFFDRTNHWLADGFHRYHAYKKAGKENIPAKIRVGSKRDATLHSLKANCKHGLRRSNADKRNAVQMVLNDAEWSAWSQEKIAKACGVSAGLVSKLVAEAASLHGEEMKPALRIVERSGKAYQQDTRRIGRSAAAASDRSKVTLDHPEAEQTGKEVPATESPPPEDPSTEEFSTEQFATQDLAAEVFATEKFASEMPQTDLPRTQVCSKEMPAVDVPELSDADRLAEAQHTIRELTHKLEQLEDRLAVEAMDYSEEEKTKAAQRIEQLVARVRHLERQNDALALSRDEYMLQSRNATKEALYWRNEAQKLKAAA